MPPSYRQPSGCRRRGASHPICRVDPIRSIHSLCAAGPTQLPAELPIGFRGAENRHPARGTGNRTRYTHAAHQDPHLSAGCTPAEWGCGCLPHRPRDCRNHAGQRPHGDPTRGGCSKLARPQRRPHHHPGAPLWHHAAAAHRHYRGSGGPSGAARGQGSSQHRRPWGYHHGGAGCSQPAHPDRHRHALRRRQGVSRHAPRYSHGPGEDSVGAPHRPGVGYGGAPVEGPGETVEHCRIPRRPGRQLPVAGGICAVGGGAGGDRVADRARAAHRRHHEYLHHLGQGRGRRGKSRLPAQRRHRHPCSHRRFRSGHRCGPDLGVWRQPGAPAAPAHVRGCAASGGYHDGAAPGRAGLYHSAGLNEAGSPADRRARSRGICRPRHFSTHHPDLWRTGDIR